MNAKAPELPPADEQVQAAAASSSSPEMMPADSLTISPGGVSIRDGRYRPSGVQLEIGGSAPGMLTLGGFGEAVSPLRDKGSRIGGSFGQAVNSKVSTSKNCQFCSISTMSVSFADVSATFSIYTPAQPNLYSSGPFARLTLTAVGTTAYAPALTSADGSVATYETVSKSTPTTQYQGRVLTILMPQGIRYDFTYSGQNLAKVVSNTGYAMVLEYTDAGHPNTYTKACVINLSRTYLAGTTCPAGVQTISLAYSADGKTLYTTERDGTTWSRVTTAADSNGLYQEKWFKTGETLPFLINNMGPVEGESRPKPKVLSQDFTDGRHFEYQYQLETVSYKMLPDGGLEPTDKAFGIGWIETNPIQPGVSLQTSLVFGSDGGVPPKFTPTPVQATDPLGRVFKWLYPTTNQVTFGNTIQGRVMPEGDSETYTYDSYRNIVSVTQKAKPGSGLADTVSTATFGNCSATSLIACNKPTQTVDAKGNATDYTYSPVHGGVLTVSAPADAGGIRPVTRYAYVQRNAWIKNAAGGYVQVTPAIWLLSEERTCRTTATVGNACAGGAADEVVTTYDYGPNSGPNTLLLRGVAVTAGGQTLRTCFTYDDYGRKLSETKPLGTGATCP